MKCAIFFLYKTKNSSLKTITIQRTRYREWKNKRERKRNIERKIIDISWVCLPDELWIYGSTRNKNDIHTQTHIKATKKKCCCQVLQCHGHCIWNSYTITFVPFLFLCFPFFGINEIQHEVCTVCMLFKKKNNINIFAYFPHFDADVCV